MKLKFTAAIFCGIALLVMAFTFKSTVPGNPYPKFIKVGHRGTRGLMPENTIIAMTKAVELGADMVEMDIHITRDGQILVYHDESFDPTYTLMPDGTEINKEERKKYTFYQMNYADIKPFIIGKKPYPAYPKQQLIPTYTPLLGELIDSVDHYTKVNHLKSVRYLVEIKSNEKTDGFDQPAPEEFIDRLMKVLKPKKLGDRLIIQSFDMRPLQVLHKKHSNIALGFLTDDKTATLSDNLAKLGFNPTFYNPYKGLVTPEMIDKCHQSGMLIMPWTVNDPAEMKKIKAMGVDGIITDYINELAGL